MQLKKVGLFCFAVCFCACYRTTTNYQSNPSDTSKVLVVKPEQNRNQNNLPANLSHSNPTRLTVDNPNLPPYVGCWVGQHGGLVKITATTVSDLNKGETAPYQELKRTDQEFLLVAQKPYRHSFLSTLLFLQMNGSQAMGLTSYESQVDLEKDDAKGMGQFERVVCESLPHQQNIHLN